MVTNSKSDTSTIELGKIRISVIVPFYNVELYFRDCIDSVLQQDCQCLELILVDDGSTDSSREIALAACAKDSRARIIAHDINHGLGPARNTGAKNAKGEYILFLNSDDYLASKTAIGKLLAMATANDSQVVAGGCVRLLPDGTFREYDHMEDRGHSNENGGFVSGVEAFLAGARLPCAQYLPPRAAGILIKKSLVDSLGFGFPRGEHEDLVYTPFLYYFAERVLYAKEIVLVYRLRPHSLSTSRWSVAKIYRYVALWTIFRDRLGAFGLSRYVGDTAINFIVHLIWKLENNVTHDEQIRLAAIEGIKSITHDAQIISFQDHLNYGLDRMRDYLGPCFRDPRFFVDVVHSIPAIAMINHYRMQFGLPTLEAHNV